MERRCRADWSIFIAKKEGSGVRWKERTLWSFSPIRKFHISLHRHSDETDTV